MLEGGGLHRFYRPLPFDASFEQCHGAMVGQTGPPFSGDGEYTSYIQLVAGKANIMADTLSRPPEGATVPEPATAEKVKVPSGSLVGSQEAGVAARAVNSSENIAVVQSARPSPDRPIYMGGDGGQAA